MKFISISFLEAAFLMERFYYNGLFAFERKRSILLLAFLFFLGLASGLLGFLYCGDTLILWMRSFRFDSVSIVGFLLCSFLPFLFSALAVTYSIPWLIYFVSFVEAFVFTFVSSLLIFSYYPIGFFVRFIFLVGDIIALPIMYFFWYSNFSRKIQISFYMVFLFLSVGFLVGCIECCVIFPISA